MLVGLRKSKPIINFVRILREQPFFSKIFITVLIDFVMLNVIVLLAFMARLSVLKIPDQNVLWLYLVGPVLSIGAMIFVGVYRAATRSHSQANELRLLYSQFLVPPIWVLILLVNGTFGFARSTVAIYFAFAIIALITQRRFVSWLLSDSTQYVARHERIPVLIYGAGREGVALAESLERQGRFRPVAFLDTDYTLVGRTVNGLKVYSTENLDRAIRIYGPKEALIAKAGQIRSTRRALVDLLLSHGLRVNVVPEIDDLIAGKVGLSSIQPVKLEDLLGRDPVPPDRTLMEKTVKGRRVMVTGAGGSIGSEIVRQIANYETDSIVLFEQNEFALFEIHREMEAMLSAQKLKTKIVPILGDVLDSSTIRHTLITEDIEVVFHAAAYKHVRMVQENPFSGIRTNVFGTQNVVVEAQRKGVGLFVLISTDKAVRPTNVMGATKRIAEMIVQVASHRKKSNTTFAIVRFGNVLGSSGSVVPLFREQIELGGPVLVTDPEASRYFMLIPEAAQLVIQASAMAKNGEVFVLDMGEPVKILNMAKSMIELAGMSFKSEMDPDGDIAIKFVGLREGEKLHEELQIGRDISLTQHQRIMQSQEVFMPAIELNLALKNLRLLLDKRSNKTSFEVMKMAKTDD